MNILSTTIPGLFCLAVGVLSIIAMRRLLPNRKAPEEAFEATGDYTVEMLVPSDNPHIGMTIGELGLNSAQGGSLIELRHFDDERILSPVPDDEPLMGGDRLVYAGQIGELLELEMSHGLVNADHPVFHYEDAPKSKDFLRTAYLPFGSHLIGTTMGTNGFEQEHKAMLVAVCRRGERIEESPRSVVLQAGDTLLLESMNEWKTDTQNLQRDLHFFESEEIPNIGWRTFVSSAIMITMVALSAFNVLPLLECAILAVFAMLIFRCCNAEQAMRSINWNILMIFACSAVLGIAIQKTGIAERMATGILDLCGTNPIVVMTAICFAGTFITEFISNTAAGAMFFPIMYNAAEQLGYEPFPFLIALMIAVSSSFATPIGSPTHMLVYGPGGYRFADFLKIGLLINIIILAANILIVNLVYPLTPLP
jgi:di/tricarboxylate transporter